MAAPKLKAPGSAVEIADRAQGQNQPADSAASEPVAKGMSKYARKRHAKAVAALADTEAWLQHVGGRHA